jgi:hypothetical protein
LAYVPLSDYLLRPINAKSDGTISEAERVIENFSLATEVVSIRETLYLVGRDSDEERCGERKKRCEGAAISVHVKSPFALFVN